MNSIIQNIDPVAPTLKQLISLEYLVASTGFTLLPKQPVNSILAGRHSSKLRGRGLDFSEVRTYISGDDIRDIDWKVTARVGKTHIKLFTEEKDKPIYLYIDLTPTMFFGSKLYTKSSIACQLATIAAFKVLKNGDRFGGVIFSEDGIDTIKPQRNRKSILRYISKLSESAKRLATDLPTISSKERSFEQNLLRSGSFTSQNSVVVIISDFYQLTSKSKEILTDISKHNDLILAQVSDDMERELPSGDILLSDGDQQLLWNNRKRNIGKEFQDHMISDQDDLTSEMKRYGIPVMQINTHQPIDSQLKEIFKAI